MTIAARQGESRGTQLARLYDLDLLSNPGDEALYNRLAAESGAPILELAVGTGRLAVPLALSGFDVTGVDNDEDMLERARQTWVARPAQTHAGTLTLLNHDLTTLDLRHRYGLVFLALNSLLLLDGRAAQERALRVMRAHLAPGGRAVIDLWLPSPQDLELYDGRQVLEWLRTDHETGERVAKTSSASYDPARHTARLTTIFDVAPPDGVERRIVRDDDISFIAKDELLDMAANAGLQPEVIAGDYDLNAWSETSERVVLVCRSSAA